MRKYLKPLAIALLSLLVIIISFPILFRERLITEFKKTVNANLHGKIEFKDLKVSIFKNFPKITLTVTDIHCNSYVLSDTTTLFKSSEIQLGFNIWNLIKNKDRHEISKIVLVDPYIQIIQYDSVNSNYNIFPTSKDDTKSGALSLEIESYKIIKGTILFKSVFENYISELHQINHEGNFKSTESLIQLITTTTIEDLSFEKNNMGFLQKIKLNANLDLNYTPNNKKLEISKGTFKLNDLNLDCTGYFITMGDSLDIMFELNSANNTFKELFSILPNAYTKEFNSVSSNGLFNIHLKTNGIYHQISNLYPSWKFIANVQDGFIKYPAKSVQLENVQLDVRSENVGPGVDNSFIDLKEFSFSLNKQPINGSLKLTNLINNITAKGFIKGILNLTDITDFYPIEIGTTLSGKVTCDVNFDFSEDAITKKQYDKIISNGLILIDNLKYTKSNEPDFKIIYSSLNLSPNILLLDKTLIQLGNSDLQLTGNIEDPLNFITVDKDVKATISSTSKLFNVDEWMNKEKSKLNRTKINVYSPVPNYISKLKFDIQATFDRMQYEDYKIENVKAKGILNGDNLSINKFSGIINENEITGNGEFAGLYLYVMEDKVLDGNLNLSADKFDANKFIIGENKSADNKSGKPVSDANFIVPENFNISVNFQANEVYYSPMVLKKSRGSIKIINNDIQFNNLTADISGGQFSLQGLYNTTNPEVPYFNVKLDLVKIPFTDALSSFNSLKIMAPVLQYVKGFFNSNLILEGDIGKGMNPVLESMKVDGFIETIEGSITGFKPLDLMSEKLKLTELKNISIQNTKNWISVSNGLVSLKEFTKKIDDIELKVGGTHRISGPMDYNIIIKLPKSKIAKFTSDIRLDKSLDKLNGILQKVGLEAKVPNNLNILVNLKGSATNPEFAYKLLTGDGESVDSAENLFESAKAKLKDSVKTRADEEFSKLKEKLKQESSKLEDSLTKEATRKASELKDQIIDKSTEELRKSIDSNVINKAKDLGKSSLDSVSQKILNKDAEQIKEKLKDWNPFKKDKK